MIYDYLPVQIILRKSLSFSSTIKKKQYDFIYNSTMNRRGVGILLSRELNYSVVRSLKDADENILGLTLRQSNTTLRIFSIYGPNDNDRTFFDTLSNFMSFDSDSPIIIGGDWNATYSCDDVLHNIDTFRMVNPQVPLDPFG